MSLICAAVPAWHAARADFSPFVRAAIEKAFLNCVEGRALHPKFIDRVVDTVFAINPHAEHEGAGRRGAQVARKSKT